MLSDKPMTGPQISAILGSRGASDHWAVKRGLRERGMLDERGFPTAKATEWVRTSDAMANMLRRLQTVCPEVEVIETDSRLLDCLRHDGQPDRVDIYVYAGSRPMVVRNGDGQKPLAILHPFYLWQIEVARTAGRFLKYAPVIGHKGSYSYELDRRALAVLA